jgi:hypothetical protein
MAGWALPTKNSQIQLIFIHYIIKIHYDLLSDSFGLPAFSFFALTLELPCLSALTFFLSPLTFLL